MKYYILKKRPSIFLSLFGVSVFEFELVLKRVTPLWEKKILGTYVGCDRFFKHDLAGMILLLLLYYRHYITQEFVGMLFGLHKSNVCRIIKRLEPVLLQVVSLAQHIMKKHSNLSTKHSIIFFIYLLNLLYLTVSNNISKKNNSQDHSVRKLFLLF